MDIIGAEEFVVAEGVIDGVIVNPHVGDLGRTSVGGDGIECFAEVLQGFLEFGAIFVVQFDSRWWNGPDFVGEVVGWTIGKEGERGEGENERAENHAGRMKKWEAAGNNFAAEWKPRIHRYGHEWNK